MQNELLLQTIMYKDVFCRILCKINFVKIKSGWM